MQIVGLIIYGVYKTMLYLQFMCFISLIPFPRSNSLIDNFLTGIYFQQLVKYTSNS